MYLSQIDYIKQNTHPKNRILISNNKENTDTHKNMCESQEHQAEQKSQTQRVYVV